MNLTFDYAKLKGWMRERGITMEKLSRSTGIGFSTIAVKLSQGRPFTTDQAWRIAQALELPDIDPYFFVVKL